MARVISVDEALRIIASTVIPGPPEEMPVARSGGRVLADDLVADVDWPPFDTSAMDGYAVRLADLRRPGATLPERAAAVMAGDAPPLPLAEGETVRVMTGAPLPAGADAIVPVEDARREEADVAFPSVPVQGAHIRRRGESIARGTKLASAGERLSSSAVALAAFAGADPVRVGSRPPITIVATGNELVDPSALPGPGQLRDSNGPMLLSLCRARGWPAELAARTADDRRAVDSLFDSVRRRQILITSGGVSAGELDLLPEAAGRSGFEILFHRVAIQPGKPVVFARRADAFWFGLPGNPVSSAVGFHVFVRDALDRLEGSACPGAPRVTARLTRALRVSGSREVYRDALWRIENGASVVEPLATRGSHDLAAHARSNALIRVPLGAGSLPEGSLAECLVIEER